jgi:hypothetical protein
MSLNRYASGHDRVCQADGSWVVKMGFTAYEYEAGTSLQGVSLRASLLPSTCYSVIYVDIPLLCHAVTLTYPILS